MTAREEKIELLELLEERERREAQKVFYRLFPDQDIIDPSTSKVLFHSRDKYPKHLEFFKAGADYRERCVMAANRIGKTFSMGGFEMACHLTGLYPAWWEGRRFDHPVSAWAAGKTNESTRDIVQKTLLGGSKATAARKIVDGTGVVPGALIKNPPTWKQGVTDLVDTVRVKHVTGGFSVLGMKSYQQGRGSFEGTEKDIIWLDEEPPIEVYGECLIRTATTNGVVMLTFTPLEGISETVKEFIPSEAS